MNLGVASSLILLLLVIYVPFLQPIFNTTSLGWQQWELVLPLLFVPSLAAELTKYFLSSRRQSSIASAREA
jgi:Ca2+-transporting ATPase